VENVRGAQPWVGKAAWHYGSFYLWGDVPALMPITMRRATPGYVGKALNHEADRATKNTGGSWFNIGSPGQTVTNQNPVHAVTDDGVKGFTPYGQPLGKNELGRKHGSKSSARKAASARIAKIPYRLSLHIAQTFKPRVA
jgi:hypothetical protein